MDLETLSNTYRSKTDEELLQLAAQQSSLTQEARFALSAEIASRQIEVGTEVEQSQTAKISRSAATSEFGDSLPQRIRTGEFIEELLTFYTKHRWIFMELVFPAVLLTSVAYLFSRYEVFEIERHLPRGPDILQHKLQILEVGLLTWGSLVLSWFLFSLSFGAICIATEQIQSCGSTTYMECFGVICTRLTSLLWLCFLVFAACVICLGSLEFTSEAILLKLSRHPSSFAIWIVSYTVFGLGVLVCSRLSLSVPAFLLDDYHVGKALLRGWELTRDRSSILAVLLFKAVAGAYIVGMLPFWLARFIPANVQLPSWFGWFLTATSVALVTIVEPVMFIGFALLYLKTAPVPTPSEVQVVSA